MIVVTGAAGFIGSYLVRGLAKLMDDTMVVVDNFVPHKNAVPPAMIPVPREHLLDWLEREGEDVRYVLHMGARTDTTETREDVLASLNVEASQAIWSYCARVRVPLIYASSAATYGDGSHGYDDTTRLTQLQPLNPYGRSKHQFDCWAMRQASAPPLWYGLKFFNVYGPGEGHKGRMASMVYHAHKQLRETGRVRLFRSHRPDVADGEQQRDFVYVRDILHVCQHLMETSPPVGIYNLGSGQARSFRDLVVATATAMGVPARIEFIDTPLA